VVFEVYTPEAGPIRRVLTNVTWWLAVVVDLAGVSITSNDFRRTLFYAALLLTVHILAGGSGPERIGDRLLTSPGRLRRIPWVSEKWRTSRTIGGAVWTSVAPYTGTVVVLVASAYLVYQWTGGRTLWLDEEMIAANIRDRGFRELAGELWLGQTAPLGWLYLQRVMLVLFGTSEIALRAVPVFFGIATLGTAVWIGRRWMTPIGGAALAILCVCGFWLVYHFLELKQYSSDTFWAMLIPALAAAVVEPSSADQRMRRMAAWWTVAAIGQFFAVGAILVMPACALALVAIFYRREGWRPAMQAALFGIGWLAAFGLHYVLSLRAATESEFLRNYWAPRMPPESAGVQEALTWVVNQLLPFAEKPGGTTSEILFWVAAALGVIAAWRQSRLALFFGLVPLSGFLWTAMGLVPLADRISLWMIPAIYVTIALGVDQAVRLIDRTTARSLTSVAFGGVAGVASLIIVADISAGRTFLTQGRLDHNHALDDRSGVQWLMAHRQPGDALMSTHHGLPAVWWYGSIDIRVAKYHDDGAPIFEIGHVNRPCDDRSIAKGLSGQRRVLVYLGWTDERYRGFDDVLLNRLREVGTILNVRDFKWGRGLVVDLQPSPSAVEPEELTEIGPSFDASKFDGCLGLRPARRW
jgi:hypothetical protein